ncbi:hypothetical protein VSH64_45400 [Amycolatopsis rhabdoformis]|uniref:Uncharacterized protein n=1 Tax=Amycolatopsis rhabdoformis TaxID=1448059 RepID=A0ABZ1I674_9PSEU|nr:hypothetical protein [Amycolatopsis rhabdoformis]WSE29954.1 hypothetical protein VSH64_45400 [Amycolatopsis rhabdoformis]
MGARGIPGRGNGIQETLERTSHELNCGQLAAKTAEKFTASKVSHWFTHGNFWARKAIKGTIIPAGDSLIFYCALTRARRCLIRTRPGHPAPQQGSRSHRLLLDREGPLHDGRRIRGRLPEREPGLRPDRGFARHRCAGTGYALRKSALQADTSTPVAGQHGSPLGDLAPFRTITQDTLAKLDAGDQAGATSRVDDLETGGDNAEARLKPRDDAAWTTIDGKIDTVLRQLRATSPNPATEKPALAVLLTALG